jgi:hypothetical protein
MLGSVGERNHILLALERQLKRASGQPSSPERADDDQRLNITVVFTSVEATLAALRKAGDLASSLGGRITLVVPQVVPYPLPLESPPVLLDWNDRRFHVIAAESPVETIVRIYLCRSALDTLQGVLPAHSPVVIGGLRRFWPTREKRLARQLRHAGHEVIFTESE